MGNTDLAGNLARSLYRNADLTWHRNTNLTRNLAGSLNRDLVTLSFHGFFAVRSGRSDMSSTMGISSFSVSITLALVVNSISVSCFNTYSSDSHSVSYNIGGGMDGGVGL